MTTTVNRKKLKRNAKMIEYRQEREGDQFYRFERERLMSRKQRIKREKRLAK